MAMDKARVFLSDNADEIATQINDAQLKTALVSSIKNANAIKGLIGN